MIGAVIGLVDEPEQRPDALLADALRQEPPSPKTYIPEKHTDFDADHLWSITMGRS